MGKRIIARARGKGGPRYRAPSHRYLGKVSYLTLTQTTPVTGTVVDIAHDPGTNAPVAVIKFDDGREILHIAAEGLMVGDKVTYYGNVNVGNVLPLGKIPEGMKVFGIESYPGSGPKFCRSSGSFGIVIGKKGDKVVVRLSSGKIKELDERCLASIGVPAGAGRKEKPFVKAGTKFYAMRARGKVYPRTRGVAMNPVDHPFGGKTKPGRPKTVSRHAPPGAKVGSIAARRVGRKKK
ncbi:MAG TPA: 50S ribosomal protein L2 [Candidatus Aenigmarchaeota archaeon]|nr:50S ribosomal protein L2 [Candidatus Aenigmarchaeota archaeon]